MKTSRIFQGSRTLRLELAITLGLALLIRLLLAVRMTHPPETALAQTLIHRYVDCADGSDSGNNHCTSRSNPCATVQHATDEADPDDLILVAQGIGYLSS